ncbi:hypothetical protein DE146DRAFT_637492 [Phaeosphaeria sp. MPI-PUGE-AT-0046c]|nr:hypothetical protein DE146DRAFT_637492 [Phaeosphaeria sp. MPI-PUGE-AT-0046c]
MVCESDGGYAGLGGQARCAQEAGQADERDAGQLVRCSECVRGAITEDADADADAGRGGAMEWLIRSNPWGSHTDAGGCKRRGVECAECGVRGVQAGRAGAGSRHYACETSSRDDVGRPLKRERAPITRGRTLLTASGTQQTSSSWKYSIHDRAVDKAESVPPAPVSAQSSTAPDVVCWHAAQQRLVESSSRRPVLGVQGCQSRLSRHVCSPRAAQTYGEKPRPSHSTQHTQRVAAVGASCLRPMCGLTCSTTTHVGSAVLLKPKRLRYLGDDNANR